MYKTADTVTFFDVCDLNLQFRLPILIICQMNKVVLTFRNIVNRSEQ